MQKTERWGTKSAIKPNLKPQLLILFLQNCSGGREILYKLKNVIYCVEGHETKKTLHLSLEGGGEMEGDGDGGEILDLLGERDNRVVVLLHFYLFITKTTLTVYLEIFLIRCQYLIVFNSCFTDGAFFKAPP